MIDSKSDYKEVELIDNYSVRVNGEFNAVFKEGKPFTILEYDNNVYNTIFDFIPKAKDIIIGKDKIIIDFIIQTKKFKNYDFSKFYVNIGLEDYEFKKESDFYRVEIHYDKINIAVKTAGIFLKFKDKNGFSFEERFISMTGPHKRHENHRVYTSKIHNYKNHSVYVYETWKGFLTLTYREINRIDDAKERNKIKMAFLKHKLESKLGKNVPSILLYEKFCGKYEESAKYVYQKLIDDGWENVFFVLDKDSKYYNEVPKKYRKNLINKYSFRHYYEYFNAKAFIATESFYHAVEVTSASSLVRKRKVWNNYYYFFLQHGVMYGYSLKGRDPSNKSRSAFLKGHGFGNNYYVVVSSEKEADHFIEQGDFDREDLIKSGLPKFDSSIQNEDADKILIMPTTRNFEYSTIRDDTENSTYYKFSKRIIESVPDELKDKIVFIPHPIVMNIIGETDLEKYMPEETKYDELLKDTRLLITDYSSISFDAFYRGCNVIFTWIEKEMCLKEMGLNLMLNDDNAFADIAYDYDTLSKLISKNYYGSHSEENTRKYREIVEFHDGKNTERFIDYLYDTNLFPEKAEKASINDTLIEGIENRPYTGENVGQPRVKINYKGKKLIKNLDYSLKYKNNVDIGTATCIIKGKGIYSGTKTINFEIKADIANCKFENDEFNFKVIDNNIQLSKEIDYICEEVDHPNLGIKEIIVKGIGKYIGEKSIFKIL